MSPREAAPLLLLLAAAASAQPAAEEIAVAWPDLDGLAPLSGVPVLEAPPIRARAAAARATAASRAGGGGPYRFAEPFEVGATPASHGRWETTADGARAVWRLRVRSEGAVSLNLGFSRYRMPAGGFLRLRTPDGEGILGPFTEADNKPHGELWTPILSGGDLVIEASVPVERAAELELRIGSVNRGFRDLVPERVSQPSGDSCPVDVACSAADGYRDQVRSVGMYIHSGSGSCTGAMLNNASGDGTPYFLTARHCGLQDTRREAVTRSLVVFWNYESPTCGDRSGGSLSDFQRGAEYVTSDYETDHALLKLDDPPDPDHNVFFAGWDRSEASVPSAVLIHHPAGRVKGISATKAATFGTYGYHNTFWSWKGCHGVETGSSGAPLFDQNGRVISQFYGWLMRREDPVPRWHGGRFSLSWRRGDNSGLGKWLDPDDSGVTVIDGKYASYGPRALADLDDLALKFVQGETPASLAVDVSYGFVDPDGHELTYAASSSDDTVATVSVSGSTLTLTPASTGTATVTVTATDADGANESASQEFEVTVAGNTSPEAVGTLAAVARRLRDGAVEVAIAAAFRDADSDTLTYGVSSSDTSVATVSLSGSTVTVTPVAPGVATATATATDASGSNTAARQRFEVVVNRPPLLARFPRELSLGVGDAAAVDVSDWFEDPDGDALTYAASSSRTVVARASMSGSTLTVTGKRKGKSNVEVKAKDVDGSNLSAKGKLLAIVPERAPVTVGTLPESVLRVGDGTTSVDVSGAFTEPDGDTLTYGASPADRGVVRVRVSGSSVRLTPRSAGSTTVTVTATDVDGSNTAAEQRFGVRVLPAREVGADPSSLSVDEGSSASYRVVLKAEPSGSVTISASESGADLSVSPSSLTFTSSTWNVEQSFTVAAAEDSDALSDPRVVIRHAVNGADYGSVRAPSVTATIVENDASALSLSGVSGSESSSELVFTVAISVEGTSDVLVDYRTLDGSGAAGARAGSDYTSTSGTLTFPRGSTSSLTIAVPLLNDAADESEEETFTLELSNVRNGLLAGGSQSLRVTGTIEDDDDPAVAASFGRSSYSVTEGSSVQVVVRLDKDPERTVTLPLDPAPRGGVSEADYSGLRSDVTFGPGRQRVEFRFSATDDGEDDDGEAVELAFSASLPPRVTAGAGTVLAINDNDSGGTPPPPPGGGPGGPPPPPPDDDDEDDGGGGGFTPPRAAIRTDAECADGLCRAVTGAPIRFEDASTGSVQRRTWDFGEGSSRSAAVNWSWSEPGFHEVTLRVSGGERESTDSLVFLVEASEPAGTCAAAAGTLCLQDSRFSVEVEWWTASGERGAGRVVRRSTNDSGLFSFFGGGNWEMLVKVLDGCALNGHVWVYGASTTDLGYVIRVTDTATGEVKEYRNEPGSPARAIADATAFPEGCSVARL